MLVQWVLVEGRIAWMRKVMRMRAGEHFGPKPRPPDQRFFL
jgi:hypothetical protein